MWFESVINKILETNKITISPSLRKDSVIDVIKFRLHPTNEDTSELRFARLNFLVKLLNSLSLKDKEFDYQNAHTVMHKIVDETFTLDKRISPSPRSLKELLPFINDLSVEEKKEFLEEFESNNTSGDKKVVAMFKSEERSHVDKKVKELNKNLKSESIDFLNEFTDLQSVKPESVRSDASEDINLSKEVPSKAEEVNVKVIKSKRDMEIEKGTRLQPAEVYTNLVGMFESKENFSLRFIIKEKDSQRLELARVYERTGDKKLFVVYYPLNDTIKNVNQNPLLSQTLPKITQKLKENGIEIDDAAHLIPIAENNILKIGPFKFQIAHYVSAIMDQKQNQFDIIDSIKDRGYSLIRVIDNLREIFKPSKPRIEVTHTGKQSILNNWKCGNFVIETFNRKISALPINKALKIDQEEIKKHFEFLMNGRKSILNPPSNKIIETTQFNIPIDNREIISKELILRQIDQRIKQLKSGWNPVKESPKGKIEALKMLKTSIKEADANETFTQALKDWKTGKPSKHGKVKKFEEDDTKKIVYPDAIISEHRNRFFTPTKKTETQEFIESLEEKYGNKKLV